MTAHHAVRRLAQRYATRTRLRAIYQQFRAYTMLSEEAYIDTLELASFASAIDGCVVECGVWRGGTIAGLSKILGASRNYLLFDSFEGLPPAKEIDGKRALAWQLDVESPNFHQNCTAAPEYAQQAMQMAGIARYRIVPGWFDATLPAVNLRDKIALLHLDADWYESTTTCLVNLFEKVAPSGVIILDDYYTWDGCSRALHDYLSRNSLTERVRCHGNICYLRKR